VVGVVLQPGAEGVGGAPVREAAPRVQVGDDDALAGVEDLGGLCHEVHAAEGDDRGLGARRGLGQLEAVAHEVRQVLDLGLLVVVGQEHGVALLPEPGDLRQEVQGGVDGFQIGDVGGRRAHGVILPH